MVRQMSEAPCQEGSTWGSDAQGIWVDRGCRAEFAVASGSTGAYRPNGAAATLQTGTTIVIRTNERISAKNSNGRVFSGIVDQDVVDGAGNVGIPRGSNAELIVRSASNRDLALDLESVTVNGQRFAVATGTADVAKGQKEGVGANKRTGEYAGGGALLGSIIGAIAGGGKGAAIGAISGAAAGVGTQVLTRGRNVNVPAETLLTFRLEHPLQMGIADSGRQRNGRHYHLQNR